MFATNLAAMKIPQQPIVVRHEAVEFAVPLFREALIKFFNEGQQRTFWREPLLVTVNRNIGVPAKSLSVGSEAEAVKKVFASDQRNVPEAGSAAGIFFDRDLHFETAEQFGADGIVLHVLTQ